MNFAQLRDALLAADPLNVAHVKRVNAAEAAFWRNNQGIRVDWSDRILGFECGGEQWVSEVGPWFDSCDASRALPLSVLSSGDRETCHASPSPPSLRRS